nr:MULTISPECIES: TIGR03792 family protein [unclassified Leptolyngbya]
MNVAVQADLREQYVQKDEEIWTPVLAQYPGFLGKEVWISPDDLSNVVLVIRWASLEEWQAIPQEVLDKTEARFQEAMGGETYRITDSKRFQVRKYS